MRRILFSLLMLCAMTAISACPQNGGGEKPEGKPEIKKEEKPVEPKTDLGKELYDTNYNDPQRLLNARQLAVKNMYETKEKHDQEATTESEEVKQKAIRENAIKKWMERVD
ncbi:MAG: hypothetical protein OEY64_11250 [Nitrospinota bacterium]|nr:hypothetical protein [Nitrospinota bacterium]